MKWLGFGLLLVLLLFFIGVEGNWRGKLKEYATHRQNVLKGFRNPMHGTAKHERQFRQSFRQSFNNTLAGSNIVIGYVPLAPFVVQTANGGLEGWGIDYLDRLSIEIGFTYTLVEQLDGSYNNGIQQVANGTLDTFMLTTLTSERALLVSFSQAYVQTGLVVIVRRSGSAFSSGLHFDFFDPFSVGTWFLILASVIVYAPVIWILEKDEKRYWKHKKTEDTFKGFRNGLGNALFTSFSSFSQQGPPFTPRTALGRVYSAVFYFVILATYTADLAAFLTVTSLANDIGGVDDLQGRSVAFTANTSIESYVRTNVLAGDFIGTSNLEDALSLLQAGTVDAVIEENVVAEFILLTEPYCDLTTAGGVFNRGGWGFPFIRTPSGSSVTDEVSAIVLSLQEQQLPDQLNDLYFVASGNDACGAASSSGATGVEQLGGLFFLFGLASCVVLCCHHGYLLYIRYSYNHFAVEWPWNLPDPLAEAKERKKEIQLEEEKRVSIMMAERSTTLSASRPSTLSVPEQREESPALDE